MTITNKYNLPEVFLSIAKKYERSSKKYDYSITELLRSPYEQKLIKENYDRIEKDISEMTWALVDAIMH